MTPIARKLCRLLLISVGLFLAAPGRAAEPRPELLRYVPADTTLCVLLQGLRNHGDNLVRSPFAAQVLASPLGKAAGGLHELKELLKFEKRIEQFTGLSTRQLRDDILGDLVVLAYKNGPPGKPEQEEGLILVHARDARLLAQFVQHVNQGQKASGEVKSLEERRFRDRTYVCRQEKMGSSFYHLRDNVLLFTSSEAMLRRALEQDSDLPATGTAPIEQSLRRLGLVEDALTFWVQPRSFDAILNARQESLPESEAVILRTFLTWWKALDALAVGIRLDTEVTLNLAIAARPEDLPTAARTFFGQIAEPSPFWRLVPEEPLLALTAQLDLKSLLDLSLEFLPGPQRKTLLADLERTLGAPLGRELVREVLPAIGPDMALLVLPPGKEKVLVPSLLFAVRVQPSPEPAPIDQSIWETVHSFATVLVFAHNQKVPEKSLFLRRSALDRIEIRSVVGEQVLPAGLQPSYALARGYLFLGSSPEVLRSLIPQLNGEMKGNLAASGPLPVMRVSFKAWRDFVTTRQPELMRQLANSEGLTAEEAQARITAVLTVLGYLDHLEVRHQPAPGRLLLQIALKPRWPLK